MSDNPTSGRSPRRAVIAAAFALPLAAAAPRARAAEFSGVNFDDTVELGGALLQLNGVGLRSLFILKAYVAGLYVPERSSDAADLLAQTGPRRFEIKMLVEMSSDRLMKYFRDGLAMNHNEVQLTALRAPIEQFADAMRALGTARKGDTVDLDLVDGQLSLLQNGQPRGLPIPGEEFFASVLRVFIGARVADRDLKRGLLGG